MQPNSSSDYKQLLTDVIKKQIVILGPDITLSKARNVKGLTVANDGTVTAYVGSPQEVTQALIDQFVQLSGLIVKKTMEPLLLATQPQPAPAQQSPVQTAPNPPAAEVTSQPVSNPNQPTTSSTEPIVSSMPVNPQLMSRPEATVPQPQVAAQTQQPVIPPQQTVQPEVKPPAENPLAA